jgi:hypothetical protein
MFSDSESILTDEILQGVKKDKIPTFDAEQIQADLEEATGFLKMFATGLQRPGTNIIKSMRLYMPSVLGLIYGLYDRINFKDGSTISDHQLFTSFLPD